MSDSTFVQKLGVGAAAVIGGIVIALLIDLAPGRRQERFARTFAPAIAGYQRSLGSLVPREGAEIPDAHVRRKVLAIEVDDGQPKVSEVQRLLDRTLVANNVDEVKGVAWINVTRTKVGVYQSSKAPKAYDALGRRIALASAGGTPALRCSMEVTLLDPASKKVTAFARFEGPPPPETLSASSTWEGCPRDQVAAWIGGLPAAPKK